MFRKTLLVIVLFLIGFAIGNTAKAADVNGYTAQYECIAGGANCNVDVATLTAAACAQTITTADSLSTIESKLDTGSSPICITNGDYTGKGTITITASGTSGSRRVLRYYRSGDSDDDPWDQTSGNQAKIKQMVVNGDYWIIHRITLPTNTTNGVTRLDLVGNNIIANRILLEGPGGTNACQEGVGIWDDNTTLQNSVIRDARTCTAGSPVAVQIVSGSNVHVVNNEVYNWCEHALQVGYNEVPTTPGFVAENNDLYLTSAMYAGDGDASAGSVLGMKSYATSANPIKIIQNRLWGVRPQDSGTCGTPDSGHALQFNASTTQNNEYVLIQNNIITDSYGGIGAYNNTNERISIIGNLFYDIGDKGTGIYSSAISFYDMTASEVYLNTFVLMDSGTINADNGVLAEWGGKANLDIRCNVIIASPRAATDATAASSIADFNVFYDAVDFTFNGTATNIDKTINTRANSTAYSLNDIIRTTATPPADGTAGDFLYKVTTAGTSAGSPPAYGTTLGGTTTDGTMVVTAIRGPYSFYRKLNTSAELVYIPYTKAHNSSPDYSYCPATTGSRTGIGVNNQTGTW